MGIITPHQPIMNTISALHSPHFNIKIGDLRKVEAIKYTVSRTCSVIRFKNIEAIELVKRQMSTYYKDKS